jgi:hypothetical protein
MSTINAQHKEDVGLAVGEPPVYLNQDQVCELAPGVTKSLLAQLRFRGTGPKFLKPTPKTVIYRRADVIAWLEASERSTTAEVA